MVCANGFWDARVNVICYKNPLKKYVVRTERAREKFGIVRLLHGIPSLATRLISNALPGIMQKKTVQMKIYEMASTKKRKCIPIFTTKNCGTNAFAFSAHARANKIEENA